VYYRSILWDYRVVITQCGSVSPRSQTPTRYFYIYYYIFTTQATNCELLACFLSSMSSSGGREDPGSTAIAGLRLPGAPTFFLSRVNFQTLALGLTTPDQRQKRQPTTRHAAELASSSDSEAN
jgi:hypothetical protein